MPISRSHCAKRRLPPGQLASPSQGHEETNRTSNYTHSHPHLGTNESPVNLTCMFWACWRKLDYLQKKLRVHRRNTPTPHRRSSVQKVNLGSSHWKTTALRTAPLYLFNQLRTSVTSLNWFSCIFQFAFSLLQYFKNKHLEFETGAQIRETNCCCKKQRQPWLSQDYTWPLWSSPPAVSPNNASLLDLNPALLLKKGLVLSVHSRPCSLFVVA